MPVRDSMKTFLPGTAPHLLDELQRGRVWLGAEGGGEEALSIAVGVGYVALAVLMLLLNALPIAFLCAARRERCLPMDRLILALSITHSLATILPATIAATCDVHDRYTCYVYQVCGNWWQMSSVCLVTALSVERWTVLRNSITQDVIQDATQDGESGCVVRRQRDGDRNVAGLLVLVYGGALALACLPLLGLAPPTGTGTCHGWLTTRGHLPQQHVFVFVYLLHAYLHVAVTGMLSVSHVLMLCGAKRAATWRPHRSLSEFSVMVLAIALLSQITWIPALVSIPPTYCRMHW